MHVDRTDKATGLAAHFSTVVAASDNQGPLAEVVRLLASGVQDPDVFRAVLESGPAAHDPAFRHRIRKLVLGFVEKVVEDAAFTAAEEADVLMLRRLLRVADGDLIANCPTDVEAILDRELDRILGDRAVSDTEALFQVRLQAALGLSYDDYLRLTRRGFERVFHELSAVASAGPPQAAAEASRQLSLIEPVYLLTMAAGSSDRPG